MVSHSRLRKQQKKNQGDIVQLHFHEDGSLAILPTSEKAMTKFTNLMLNNAFAMMKEMVKRGKRLERQNRRRKKK